MDKIPKYFHLARSSLPYIAISMKKTILDFSIRVFFPLKKMYLFIFSEFIGVTLVNKIMQVSGVQSSNMSSIYCIVCSPPQIKVSFHHHLSPLYSFCLLHPPFPLVITTLLSVQEVIFCLCFCLIPSLFSPCSLPHPV